MKEHVYFMYDSPVGEMRIYTVDGRPALITLPGNAMPGKEATFRPPREVLVLLEALEAYFRGGDVPPDLAESMIEALPASPFECKVLSEVARIPRGQTRSYGEIAELAGFPRAARAVGNVMHGNPFPVVIPCHRVIRSDGSLGGYGGAEETKEWLLRFEGCEPKA